MKNMSVCIYPLSPTEMCVCVKEKETATETGTFTNKKTQRKTDFHICLYIAETQGYFLLQKKKNGHLWCTVTLKSEGWSYSAQFSFFISY
jgi:hypothetical protein